MDRKKFRKGRWLRKRVIAGIMAGLMVMSSMQLPGGMVSAEEAGILETENPEAGKTDAIEEPIEEPVASGAGDTEKPGEIETGNTGEPGEGETGNTGEPGEGETGNTEESKEPVTDDTENTGDVAPGENGTPEEGEIGGSPENENTSENGEEKPSEDSNGAAPGGEDTDGSEISDEEKSDNASISENDMADMPEQGSLTMMSGGEVDGINTFLVSEGFLDLENLTTEYTALDGTAISSAAQGRPKMLVFYSNGCGNCINTISGISASISRFSGTDVYAIETTGKTQEAVAEFKGKYGCDGILFSYDEMGYLNQNSMWNYVNKAGFGTEDSISWPVICYIDANNRLQYVTTGYQAAGDILSNLQEYCRFTEAKSYKITYILCGGTNSKDNPAAYTSDMDKVVLQDAVRTGHQFEGWYREAAYTTRVTEIPKGTAKETTLYAKWSPLSAVARPQIDMTPAEGNVLMTFSGTYYTETADKILKRLNAIRLEACKEGVKNPNTGQPLTLEDYVPLYWSSDLEEIARLRAAEATVSQAHTRPDGTLCFTARTTNGISSSAENLAWNYSGLMEGIEQWYGEKSDWVNPTGEETGHYTSIINPRYRAVGLGAFCLSSGGWCAVAQQFSSRDTLDAYKNPEQGKCVQAIEVQGGHVTGLAFEENLASFIREGDVYRLSLTVNAQYPDFYGRTKSFSGAYQAGGSWTSSDETVVSVDDTGMVSARAKGTATISVAAGTKQASFDITVYGRDESPILVERPTKTTYKVGQKLDVSGGKVTYLADGTGETKTMTIGMLSGFDSSKPGICPVTVTCGGYAASFDTLIVEEPDQGQMAEYGQILQELPLPPNDYGTYSWQDGSQVLNAIGTHTFMVTFTPDDQEHFQTLTDLKAEVTIQRVIRSDFNIAFKQNSFLYNGTEQEPKVVVSVPSTASPDAQSDAQTEVLAEGRDYILSYENNREAGTATVIVTGTGFYTGGITAAFEIQPAPVVIKAKDKTILVGDRIPAVGEYAYDVTGLAAGDTLMSPPVFSCYIPDTETTGQYDIVPGGADAGTNYRISYEKGRLTIAFEYVSCTVTYDVQGHGTAPASQVGIRVGDTIESPKEPSESGYRFDGWYQDAACTKDWNFDTDTVQSDIILYAKWLCKSGSMEGDFVLQEITDVYYTGKAQKPSVSVYDGETLLKAGKDYQIKYYNNLNANKEGRLKRGNGSGADFDPELPYAEIIGKGNYTDLVRVNFNILPASIGDGSENPAPGVVLKTSEQLTVAKKAQKPFASIKYKKAMKQNVDFTLQLTVINARDQSGRSLPEGLELSQKSGNAVITAVPAGYEGEFRLSIQGEGNYEGSICRTIYVTDKQHLIKNAKVTLGKNLKNIEFDGRAVQLTPAESDSPDVFTVKIGGEALRYNKDYQVSYRNHDRIGKAELVITGMGEYYGVKTVSFNIKGVSLTAQNVRVDQLETSVIYSGKAVTQNGVVLTYGAGTENERELQYGMDYTISYAKNINKGTATMTIKGLESAGFGGSFRKTFQITAADIGQTEQAAGMQDITVRYSKAGVKPAEEIILTNQAGMALVNGKDYTLRYANNKAVADKTDEKPPTVIVKGRGNYTGELPVYFTIVKGDLQGETIQIKTSAAAYQKNKAADYVYKPSVKLTDGKMQLRAGVDYEIAYEKNTQAEYESYLQYLENAGENTVGSGDVNSGNGNPQSDAILQGPHAVITAVTDGNYTLEPENSIIVPLPVYCNKLKKSNLMVEIEEAVYTGATVRPAVKVSYQGEGQNNAVLLTEDKDYKISYGANIASGRKKGSITISGIGPYYGGDVTVKFDIEKKKIMY